METLIYPYKFLNRYILSFLRRYMKTAFFLVLFFAAGMFQTSAQERQVFTDDGKRVRRGYSRVIGDRTFYYTSAGEITGYSQGTGNKIIDYDKQGRVRGYQQAYGDKIYRYTPQGEKKAGYELQGPDTGDTGADFPTEGKAPDGYWGFSGPTDERSFERHAVKNFRGQDEPGAPDGYTRKIGDQVIEFDSEGREIGRERVIDDVTVTHGEQGEQRRYVSPGREEPVFSEPHNSNTWGFSKDERFDVGK